MLYQNVHIKVRHSCCFGVIPSRVLFFNNPFLHSCRFSLVEEWSVRAQNGSRTWCELESYGDTRKKANSLQDDTVLLLEPASRYCNADDE